MKNRHSFYVYLILLICFIVGCDLHESDDTDIPEFEAGYYYTTSRGSIDLFRCNSLIAVIFDSSITVDRVSSIIQFYNLEPIMMFENNSYNVDWDRIIENDITLMKLPNGAILEDYLSTFPKKINQKFGDIQEVNFCLPVFALDSTGDPTSRFIINDEIIISSKVDSGSTLVILKDYNLVFVSKNEWSEYKFKISHDSPANTLIISNSLYDHDEFNWSMPNGYAYISPNQ